MSDMPMTVEAELRIPGITFQIRNYSWPTPLETVTCQSDHVLNLSTIPRPRLARGTYRPSGPARRFRDFGELVLAPADIELYSWATGGPHRAAYFGFNPRRFQTLCQFGGGWDDFDLDACLDIRNPRVKHAMLQLADEAASPGFASGILVEALSTTIMVELSRHFRADPARAHSRHGRMNREQVRRISDYLDGLPVASPAVGDLAALCGISPRHLMRVFKETTGQTLSAHVEQMKVRKAENFLADTDLPIKEISFRLGFANASNFSTSFKRAKGVTPLAYRRMNPRRGD